MASQNQASSVNKAFYQRKRVMVTGHTGFKGAWLTVILHLLNAQVLGYALPPESGSLFERIAGEKLLTNVYGDIRDKKGLADAVAGFQPEIIIHLAAVVGIQECLEQPVLTYDTNVMGTIHLLEAVRGCSSVKSVVLATTDKVYENNADGKLYNEWDPLGGSEPYSSSKTCVEHIARCYQSVFLQNIGVATVRASNVIAGGDHVETRLIPSILTSFARGGAVQLRNPDQTRPWQSALDALNGYLSIGRLLTQNPKKYSTSWNIGPEAQGVRSVEEVFSKMKLFYQSTMEYERSADKELPESAKLGLDITKALTYLDWRPEQTFEKMLYDLVDFFKRQCNKEPEIQICRDQVRHFYGIKNI